MDSPILYPDLEDDAQLVVRVLQLWERSIPALSGPRRGIAGVAARILEELRTCGGLPAARIGERVRADPSSVSRAVAVLRDKGLVEVRGAWNDARMLELHLTSAGRQSALERHAEASNAARHWLESLEPRQDTRIRTAMRTFEAALSPDASNPWRVAIRDARPGDLGWIVERHGALFTEQFQRAEEYAAAIVHGFIRRMDGVMTSVRERAFVAESGHERVGALLLTQSRAGIGQVRLLFAEPFTLGLGVERQLLVSASTFARGAGYARLVARLMPEGDVRNSAYASTGFAVGPAGDFALGLRCGLQDR